MMEVGIHAAREWAGVADKRSQYSLRALGDVFLSRLLLLFSHPLLVYWCRYVHDCDVVRFSIHRVRDLR
jgi:hypothetical protein